MRQSKNRKKKRVIFIVAAILLLAAYAAGAFFLLRAGGEKQPANDVRNYNDDSSLILLTGNDYSLEEEQEEQYIEQQTKQEEQTKPPEKKEKKTAESIVPQQDHDADDPGKGGDKPGPGPGDGPGPGGGDDGGDEGGDPEPDIPDTKPIIETNISSEPYGRNVAFTVRGIDYKGRVIDSFYYTVTFDGAQIYSTGVDGNGNVTYRANEQAEGSHEVGITIKDTEGNENHATYTLQVAAEADVPTDAWATLTVEARVIGYGTVLSTTEQIYKDESAAQFVKRVLTDYGFAPGMDDGSYLYQIGGINAGEANVPDAVKPFVEEHIGELYGPTTPGVLGERDYAATSGWVYLYNGVYQGVGLYGVTLVDGDEIHIGFSLGGGTEYNGAWLNYGEW